MIIPKKYGGLEFSAYAHSTVVVKIASRSSTVASTVVVPNSLGRPNSCCTTEPGTEEALPAAARARRGKSPASASPVHASARMLGSMPDTGLVCRGLYQGPRDARHPAQLFEALHHARADRDHHRPRIPPVRPPKLIGGDKTDYGITVALVPARYCRHYDRPPAFSAERPVPERSDPGQGRVRAAGCDHRRAEDGGPGLAHAGRTALGRPLHFAALHRDRRRKGRRTHPPPTRASVASSTCRSASSKASRP